MKPGVNLLMPPQAKDVNVGFFVFGSTSTMRGMKFAKKGQNHFEVIA